MFGSIISQACTSYHRALLTLGVFCAFALVLSAAPAAHAQAATGNNLPTGWSGTVNGASVPTGITTTQLYTFGSPLAQDNIGTDYGMIANTFLARFGPILVLCGIAGAVMIASKSGVRLLHGWLRGAFSH